MIKQEHLDALKTECINLLKLYDDHLVDQETFNAKMAMLQEEMRQISVNTENIEKQQPETRRVFHQQEWFLHLWQVYQEAHYEKRY